MKIENKEERKGLPMIDDLVIKRDGSKVPYDIEKIGIAISGAFQECGTELSDEWLIKCIDVEVRNLEEPTVEQIQDIVETYLMKLGYLEEAKAYIRYRYKRELIRKTNTTDKSIRELLNGDSEFWNTENSNKNAKWITTQRDYIAGITSKDIARRFIFPKEVMDAHDAGLIHIHDLDYAAQNTMSNCCLINLNDMLQNGTVINGVKIDKPHRLLTAMTIATQIIASVASSQYGGTSINMAHLAPFVRDSYEYHCQKYLARNLSEEISQKYAAEDLSKEIEDAVQTFNYQLNSLTTTNGQSPFVSAFLYLGDTEEYKDELALLIQEIFKQRIQGMKNVQGVYVTPAFPKLLYVLEEDNVQESSPYWYLTQLAAKCTAKRMVPDYISEKKMKELKLSKGEQEGDGDCYACMGCRSFLTPDRSGNGYDNVANALDYDGKPKYWGRFNIGVCTINLPDVALTCQRNSCLDFWEELDSRLELCHTVQRIRANRLSNTKAEVAPILWCDGAFARLQPQETLDKLIHGGFCTSSIGYAGLYGCVKVMTGHSHTEPEGKVFGLQVMQHLNDKCNQWKLEENIDYSLYGSPIESTTQKFAQCLQSRFGEIKGITDRDYVTNSYHVPVFEEIDAFEKLSLESEFQELSPGGWNQYNLL